ncbi:MAG TPA: MFS transporter, partial [Chloroflexota bacterium]|nr:MFS transporter [Chloroflexota bacterium]
MFGALRGRDFRLFWTGAFISNIGSWIQSIALSWLVYQVSNSAFALGAVNFAGSMPILLFSLIGGVYVDRIDRRRVLLITQTLALVFAMLLAAMTFANVAQISYILTIVLLTGIVMAVNSPAWQAFIVDIV